MGTPTEDATRVQRWQGKLPLALSIAALVVALLGTTGPAVAHGVRHALFAHNAGKVDGKSAVGAGAGVNQRKGKLVATSVTSGRLPNSIIAKAPDADRLDGLDSTALGLGFFVGRVNGVDTGFAGAVTGLSQAGGDPSALWTLSPDRPIRMRELAAKVTNPVPQGIFTIRVFLSAYAPNGTDLVAQLSCQMFEGESECAAAGPSDVIPPRSLLELVVGSGTGPPSPGTDLLFSWRAQAP